MKFQVLLILTLNTFYCADLKFFTSNGINQDEYCFQTLGDGCQNCFMSFLNDETCQPPAAEIPNCIRYRDSSYCSMCQLGMQLINNECVQIEKPDYCIRKNLVGQCDLCRDGLYIDSDNNCTQKCTLDKCDICEFDTLNNHEKCFLCKSGYASHLEDDGTKLTYSCAADSQAKNCWIMRPNFVNKCYKCKINYYQNDKGECIKTSKYNTQLMNGIRLIASSIFLYFFLNN